MSSIPLPRSANALALTASWVVFVLLMAAAVLYAIYGPEIHPPGDPEAPPSAEEMEGGEATSESAETTSEPTADDMDAASGRATPAEESVAEDSPSMAEPSDTPSDLSSDTEAFAPEPEVTEIPLPAPGESQANGSTAETAEGEAAPAPPVEETSDASESTPSPDTAPQETTTPEPAPDEPSSALESAALPDESLPPIPDPATSAVPKEEESKTEASIAPATQDAAPVESEPQEAEVEDSAPSDAGAPEEPEAKTQQFAALPPLESRPDVAWQRFRSPFDIQDRRPRIAVVISGLGLASRITEAAIKRLPPAVTLSFSPYARNLETHIAQARADGHEVMLDLPMEPMDFPQRDPGPQALLTGVDEATNLARLQWVMDRGSAYVGLASVMGSRFTSSPNHMRPVLELIRDRGLLFLDNGASGRDVSTRLAQDLEVPVAFNNRAVDGLQASREAIDARLAEVERIALTDGFAVAMGQPYPVTLERIATWAEDLDDRGFTLAPITALANRQALP